jgi:flagellar hook-associated protein 2
MASVSSLGIGSNLDLAGLLADLTKAESQPLVMLQQQQISYTAKLSAYGTLQGALSTLQAAAAKLGDAALFKGIKTTSSATDVLSATGVPTAPPGIYTVDVSQLASAQSLAAAGVSNVKAAVGKGTVTIDFGTISGGTLDPATGLYSGASFSRSTPRPTSASRPPSSMTAALRPTAWC